MTEFHALPPSHLLHLLPGQDVLRPPAGFRLRVPVLRSPPAITQPDQLGEISPGLGCLQDRKWFGQEGQVLQEKSKNILIKAEV